MMLDHPDFDIILSDINMPGDGWLDIADED